MESIGELWQPGGYKDIVNWVDGTIAIVLIMFLYYYKSWVDWHFKNKNFDAKFKQTATIQVSPEKTKRKW